MKDEIIFNCLKVIQPIGEFYLGVMDHNDLIHISYADIRRLQTGNERREVEIYSGIQRELSKSRVKDISQYVNMVDATFPSSIILHLDPDNALYVEAEGVLKIPYENNVAKILDGQHRIAGLESFMNTDRKFQLNVTIFVGMELEDQAIVFATINKTQTKVNKSLVADLYEFATTRSPQKTSHNIVRALNQKDGSPFKDKIKILGSADDSEKETITQATFTGELIKFISKNPMLDRDLYKRGNKPDKFEGKDLLDCPFRNLFVQEEDSKIAKIIWNYFEAVKNKWPRAWNMVEREMVLNKSTGFIALMRFLRDVYNSFNRVGDVIEVSEFSNIFESIGLLDREFTRDNYLPGTGGQSKLYKDLLSHSGLKKKQ